MTPYRVASIVACRIFALYLFVVWAGVLVGPISLLVASGPWYRPGWTKLVMCCFALIPSVLLWILAPWIAKHIVRVAECDLEEEPKVSLEAIQITAFALLGIYFVVQSLPQAISAIQSYYYLQEVQGSCSQLISRYFVVSLIKAGLGVWLFVGSRGFVKVFRKLQTAGLPKDD